MLDMLVTKLEDLAVSHPEALAYLYELTEAALRGENIYERAIRDAEAALALEVVRAAAPKGTP